MILREMELDPFLTLSPFQTTDEAIDLMWTHDVGHLGVCEHGEVSGLVTAGDLLESVGMLRRAERACVLVDADEALLVADVMDEIGPVLSADATAEEAVTTLVSERRSAVLVLDGGRPAGVFTEQHALQVLGRLPALAAGGWRGRPVVSIASRVICSVGATDAVRRVCEKLHGSADGWVVVLHTGRLVGVVRDWDIRRLIRDRSGSAAWSGLPADQVAMEAPVVLRPDDTLAQAAERMRVERVSFAPVTTQDDVLLGVIRLSDVLRAATAASVGASDRPVGAGA